VSEVIRAESVGRARREVIGITGIGKARRYAREAVALAYQAPGEDLLISLAVDGEPSDDHDAAFARTLARSARKVVAQDWHDAREIAANDIPIDVLDHAADPLDAERIQEQRHELQEEDQRLRSAAQHASEMELQALRAQLDESRNRQRELEAALENISVRQVPVYEHRRYLDRAFEEATAHILIVSPWIRHEVVDDQLTTRFRRLLERGIELWIAYGFNKRGDDRAGSKGQADREALQKLQRLGQDFPEYFHLTRLGDTHAKVLVCDSRFSVVTSFNWLSFRGDERLEFRDERGYYVGLPQHVDDLFDSYRERFPEPRP
jgi:phosphatidylserine/phosphatidylglycerophosphate/cardiolipin synthase-like enzyme